MSKERASKRFYRVDSAHDFVNMMDRGQAANFQNRWTFETAWEVCNKGDCDSVWVNFCFCTFVPASAGPCQIAIETDLLFNFQLVGFTL